MSDLRRDKIPIIAAGFMNLIWTFSSFLSVDMIKLYTYYFMTKNNYPALYYTVFTISMIFLIFIKFNKVFTTIMLIWFNFIIHILLVIFIFFPLKGNKFYYILVGLWSHLYALNLISSLYMASYSRAAMNGFILGSAFTYYASYLFTYAVENPSDFSIKSRKNTCNWFIVIRCLFAILAFAFYIDYLKFYYYLEYRDSSKRTSMTNLFKWVDNEPLDVMDSVRVSELMPCSLDFKLIWKLIQEIYEYPLKFQYLVFIYLTFTSTTFYSPFLTPISYVISVYTRDYIYLVEFIGGFLGIIVAVMISQFIDYIHIPLYLIHFVLTCFRYDGYNTYKYNLYNRKYILILVSFLSQLIGCYVLIDCLLKYISGHLVVHCKEESKGPCAECCKNDTSTCLCYNKDLKETCKTNGISTDFTQQCICIWVPFNNHQTYRDWNHSDCTFCLSQNYQNIYKCCSSGEDHTCECCSANKGCCACCCPQCEQTSGCKCNSNCDNNSCGESCCCSNGQNKVCHYLLRNCVLSCCPYCDYCLLFECEKIKCVCPCVHKTHQPRNQTTENKKLETEKKSCLTKIQLNTEIKTGKHILLCTYVESPDITNLKKWFCCCKNGSCTNQNKKCCCIKCCINENSENTNCDPEKICGKHFNFAYNKASQCCHYDFKFWVSLTELNSKFHIGQQPFPNKFGQVNSLIFTNKACTNCCENCTCCNGKKCKSVDVLRLAESDIQSESGGAIKLDCENTNNTCKCCCCCCKEAEKCKCCCCCGKNQSPCSCSKKKCCAIRVLPTNLPYHFKKLDIQRTEIVSLICFTIILFCIVKFIMSIAMAVKTEKHTLRLNVTLKNFKNINNVDIKHYKLQNYSSDVEYANKLLPDYDGPQDVLVQFATDLEKQALEKNVKLVKTFMDELNSLELDQWLEELIKDREKLFPTTYTLLKLYAHINSFLQSALTTYALKNADRIYIFVTKFTTKWDIEWNDFEKRFLEKIKVLIEYSKALSNIGYFDTGTELQRLIGIRQNIIKNTLTSKHEQLTGYISKTKQLTNAISNSKDHELLLNHVDLWLHRYELIMAWSTDHSLFLDWTSFTLSMKSVSLWNEHFRDLYTKSYINKYKSNQLKT